MVIDKEQPDRLLSDHRSPQICFGGTMAYFKKIPLCSRCLFLDPACSANVLKPVSTGMNLCPLNSLLNSTARKDKRRILPISNTLWKKGPHLARHQAGSDLTDVLSHASSNDPLNHPFLNWKHPDHQIGGFHESPLQNVVANRG